METLTQYIPWRHGSIKGLTSRGKPSKKSSCREYSSKRQLITVANGNHCLQSFLSLHNVLHVPKLANNLISIYRLIQDWNCALNFFILIFSRHHRAIFSLSNNKSLVPFDLIHSNNPHFSNVCSQCLLGRSCPNYYLSHEQYVLNSISSFKHMLSFFPSSSLMLSLLSRVFGFVAFIHSHNSYRGKLDPRAIKYIFIGYHSNEKRDVRVQEVNPKELITTNSHNEAEEEDQYYGKQYQRPTLVSNKSNCLRQRDIEEKVYIEILLDSILMIKRTRYVDSRRHCMNPDNFPEHDLEDLL
ncbi:hypothetical protein CR513_50186, partial [Mucuna pruriens]